MRKSHGDVAHEWLSVDTFGQLYEWSFLSLLDLVVRIFLFLEDLLKKIFADHTSSWIEEEGNWNSFSEHRDSAQRIGECAGECSWRICLTNPDGYPETL